MTPFREHASLTVCVLTYGNHFDLARRCIDSILANSDRSLYRLVVGANAVGRHTDHYLRTLKHCGAVYRVHRSGRNLNKNPMMRRMFTGLNTEYLCWFDDDSYVVETGALKRLLERARQSPRSTVMWGNQAVCNHPRAFIDIDDVQRFVRSASWYRGLTPPGWAPGGKGEFNFEGRGIGNPRWEFITGGFWLMRTSTIRALDWPDRRLVKLGDDVLLGEAIRQHGWSIENAQDLGIAISQAPRRGLRGGLKHARRVKPQRTKDYQSIL
jgi:GT2 family glycosyltransferase